MVFAREAGGRELTFGVSGLLYKSNVLMYDRQSESLWSQVRAEAVTGPMSGTGLERVPMTITSWKKWRRAYPETLVLSRETGYDRNYDRDPYERYYRSRTGLFSLFSSQPDGGDKEWVVGVVQGGKARAYRVEAVRNGPFLEDRLGGHRLRIELEPKTDQIIVRGGAEGTVVPHVVTYWFVWKDFHPESALFSAAP